MKKNGKQHSNHLINCLILLKAIVADCISPSPCGEEFGVR